MHTPKSKSKFTDGAASWSTSGFVMSLPQKTTRTHKERNINILDVQTARGRQYERWSYKLSDLEACFAQLQEELKKTKHSSKRQSLLEVEQGNIYKSSSEMSSSESEDDLLQQLLKISQERDKAWALELAAVRKHHSLDIAALTSAKVEIQKLKIQLEMVTELEAVQTRRAEFAEEQVRKLQCEVRETLALVESLKAEARQCRASEVHTQRVLSKTQSRLETVCLSSTSHEAYDSSSLEMEQSVDCAEDASQLKNKIRHLKSQVSELRAALDASEKSTLQIRDASEVAKSESRSREAESVAELKRVKLDIEKLQPNQKNKAHEENAGAVEVKQASEKLKVELEEAENEKKRTVKRAAACAETRKIADSKVVYLTQEAERNSRRVARLMEQLEAAQAANMESEMELRRQKVQCDQWRKAAETAAAMLNRDREKQSDKGESECNNSDLTSESNIGSESYYDDEDDTSKKKNGSMLRKMGVLWKKSNSMKRT